MICQCGYAGDMGWKYFAIYFKSASGVCRISELKHKKSTLIYFKSSLLKRLLSFAIHF